MRWIELYDVTLETLRHVGDDLHVEQGMDGYRTVKQELALVDYEEAEAKKVAAAEAKAAAAAGLDELVSDDEDDVGDVSRYLQHLHTPERLSDAKWLSRIECQLHTALALGVHFDIVAKEFLSLVVSSCICNQRDDHVERVLYTARISLVARHMASVTSDAQFPIRQQYVLDIMSPPDRAMLFPCGFDWNVQEVVSGYMKSIASLPPSSLSQIQSNNQQMPQRQRHSRTQLKQHRSHGRKQSKQHRRSNNRQTTMTPRTNAYNASPSERSDALSLQTNNDDDSGRSDGLGTRYATVRFLVRWWSGSWRCHFSCM